MRKLKKGEKRAQGTTLTIRDDKGKVLAQMSHDSEVKLREQVAKLEKKLADQAIALASVDVELGTVTDIMELGRVMSYLKEAGIETSWAAGKGLETMSPAEGVQILAMQLKSAWSASGAAAARGLGGLTLCEVIADIKKDQKELIEARKAMSPIGVAEGHLPGLVGSIVGQLHAIRQVVNPEMKLMEVIKTAVGKTFKYTTEDR